MKISNKILSFIYGVFLTGLFQSCLYQYPVINNEHIDITTQLKDSVQYNYVLKYPNYESLNFSELNIHKSPYHKRIDSLVFLKNNRSIEERKNKEREIEIDTQLEELRSKIKEDKAFMVYETNHEFVLKRENNLYSYVIQRLWIYQSGKIKKAQLIDKFNITSEELDTYRFMIGRGYLFDFPENPRLAYDNTQRIYDKFFQLLEDQPVSKELLFKHLIFCTQYIKYANNFAPEGLTEKLIQRDIKINPISEVKTKGSFSESKEMILGKLYPISDSLNRPLGYHRMVNFALSTEGYMARYFVFDLNFMITYKEENRSEILEQKYKLSAGL